MQWIKETETTNSSNDNNRRKLSPFGNWLYNTTFYVGAALVFGYIGIHLVPALHNEWLLAKCMESQVARETCVAEDLNRRTAHIEWLKRFGFNPEGTAK